MIAFKSCLVLSSLLLGSLQQAFACTTLVVGKAASADGSVMVTHSDDGEQGADPRLCFIPAKDHPPRSERPVYWDTENYPRHVGNDRGPCYEPKEGQMTSKPIGSIPQVEHTFQYFEANYGLVNENGVGIGESTCSGVFGANATGHDGQALLSIDSLSRIALERSKTSREAVQIMGDLAVRYGFYGANSFEGTGESLMVGDPDEAFIFHVLPDPTGASAIWAAQRVPDDHVGVVANMFVIREIDFKDSHNFLFSKTVQSVAKAKNWWKSGTPLDFTKIYSDGEYAHKFYSGRRMWGAYRLFGLTNLPDEYGDLRYDAVYPVTTRPAKLAVRPHDLMTIHRYYYQGTKYDMTKGIAAGPWGNPDRWTTQSATVKGNWERSIGIFRTTQAHVNQLKRTGQGSILWFGPHAAATTCFIPLAARANAVPVAYTKGNPNAISRDSAYWAHSFVFNVAKLKYSYAMGDVGSVQAEYDTEGANLVAALDQAGAAADPGSLAAAYAKHANKVLAAFWSLSDKIVEKYGDGYLSDLVALGYPDWWLKAVGYTKGPPPPPSQPNSPAAPHSDKDAHGDCDDDGVQRCVAACPTSGFGACAAHCSSECRQPVGADNLLV